MDRFVCGEALWISCGTWLGFLNGTVGAFVAAILGGLVALVVVRMTNRHQSKLAKNARERAAAAEMAGALGAMCKRYIDGKHAIQDLLLVALSAGIRWEMELKDKEMRFEINAFSYHVGFLALELAKMDRDSDEFEEVWPLLSRATSIIESVVVEWPDASKRQRAKLRKKLSEGRRLASRPASDQVPGSVLDSHAK